MVERKTRRGSLGIVVAAAALSLALLAPGSASAAGPFKNVNFVSVPGAKVKFTGGLDVSQRCRSKRTIRIFAANLVDPVQNLPGFGTATTSRSGSWSKTIAFRTHNVFVLEPKRVGGRRCAGGSILIELGGPT